MKKIIGLMFVFLLFNSMVLADYYQENEYLARSYDDARVVRVKYIEGEAYIKRSYEEGLEEAIRNLPVFDRDLAGTTDGRLELYLGQFNYLRLDYDSEIIFDQAPQLGRTRTTIRVNRGGIYLLVNKLDYGRDIEIQTPDCGIFILENGRYRVNVHTEGGTEILVYRGLTEISGETRGIDVGSMSKITMFDGDVYQMPVSIMETHQDDFDLWNIERNSLVSRLLKYRSRYLVPGYSNYEYELSTSGRWVYDRTFQQHIWIPFNPGVYWKPYYHGRWIHHPYYGCVWTSYDSWGWYTHYYGRWHWSPVYGWYWLPGKKWSPAWVAWSWNDNYYGWCPLSIWNRPVIILNNRWVKDYHYRSGFPFYSSSVIVVTRENLWSPRIHKAALSSKMMPQMRNSKISFRGRHPKLKPKSIHVSVINVKGKTIRYKKRGFLSYKKYKLMKSGTEKKPGLHKAEVYRYPKKKTTVISKRIKRYSSSAIKNKTGVRTTTRKTRVNKTQPRYQSFHKKSRRETVKDTPRKKGKLVKKTVPPKGKTISRKPAEKKQVQIKTSQSPAGPKKKTVKRKISRTTEHKKGQKTVKKKTSNKKQKKADKKKSKKEKDKTKKEKLNSK